MPCYYCAETFQDHDVVVPLPLLKARRQDHGGVLFEDHEDVYVHEECLGDPNGR